MCHYERRTDQKGWNEDYESEADRNTIVEALVKALEPLDYAYAFYEGGAAAWNRIDDWSNIDLYLVVDDDKVDQTFLATEKALKSLSPIKQKYDVPQAMWPDVSQAFYKLEKAGEYLIIDFAILKLSSKEKFLEPEIHGSNIFYFNKNDRIKPPLLDKSALASSYIKGWKGCKQGLTCSTFSYRKKSIVATTSKP